MRGSPDRPKLHRPVGRSVSMQPAVRSEEAVIGARGMGGESVGEYGLRSEWRGLTGTIRGRWATPSTWPSTCCLKTGACSSYLAPRVGGDRRRSLGRMRDAQGSVGEVASGGEERAKEPDRL